MVKLIIEDDEGKTTVVPLIRDEITIGRKEGNTIRLTERNVSRRHAKLLKQNGAVFIEDLNSYNGIKVNGNRISGRVAIAEGDRIQIGDYVLGLKMEGLEAATEPFRPAPTVKMPRQDMTASPEEAPTTEDQPVMDEAQAKSENIGRLVCLSNNFPGQEWLMEKAVMVIGRTEDNDVVINHRSISRHHARVTEENGRYTIIDMQSSNGVRVNGEEYGKVELRRGDLIDLGHVRLRFVAPGEDFVFSRDASIVDISKGGPSRAGLYVTLVIALVVVVGLIIWHFGQPTHTTSTTPDATPVVAEDTTKVATPRKPDPNVLLSKISRAVGSEQWTDAIAACAKLTGETLENAADNCAKARMEKTASEHFEAAHKANVQNKHLEVIQHFEQIPQESIYKKRDLQMVENARAKYLAQAQKNLEELIRAKSCEQAKIQATEIKKVDPDSDAEEKAAKCKIVVAVRPGPKPGPRPRPRPRPRPKPLPPKPPPKGNNLQDLNQAKVLLEKAQQAYISANHTRSIRLARQVLKLSPSNTMAIQILGASSCFMRNTKQAKWAYGRLPPAKRNLLKKICMRNGITLD